jgi:hypothetical protein
MTERKCRAASRRIAALVSASLAGAASSFAGGSGSEMQRLWLEAKFNFGLLFVVFVAIGAMFAGSRIARRDRDKNESDPD